MLRSTPYGWISQYFVGFFFSYGVHLPFWAIWFASQDISASDIGVLIGLGLASRCFANLVITPRLHKVEHLIPALRWLTLASMLAIVAHLFVGGDFWLLAGATILFNLSCGPVVPLTDAMANYYARLKLLDYGRTRLWGSIAFVAGSTVVGYLVAIYGASAIIYTALAGLAASMLLVMRNPNVMPVSETEESKERPKLTAILKDSSVVRFLVLASLIQGSHAAYYAFSSLHWKSSGISADIIGYLWSLGVIAEISVFAFSKRMFMGWSLRLLFVVASVGVFVRWGLTASTTDIWALIMVQLLHGVTFAMAHIAAIQFIQKQSQNKMVPLQALYNAIPLGAFIALMTTLSGWGYEKWGENVFWMMAAMGVIAIFIRVDSKKSVR
ncbi:3-phenylpropionate MFS transporter [Vibrio penaeicida]|uniref:3-phenylpropionic acid transporter n=1 Tax=Vibrio penaeicida TaxID=104609 RepID=A0AAV5NRA9_9VIBR|nr:3-phenylpropionate MFS transporter [Vibrio penaeicida]RTZ20971.1 3-phenylpropionate MFS transporter [Vibrio penaeicida]GLQ73215.1 3-phenylpropionic acid transporter [Vibrio penaeicida]